MSPWHSLHRNLNDFFFFNKKSVLQSFRSSSSKLETFLWKSCSFLVLLEENFFSLFSFVFFFFFLLSFNNPRVWNLANLNLVSFSLVSWVKKSFRISRGSHFVLLTGFIAGIFPLKLYGGFGLLFSSGTFFRAPDGVGKASVC